MLESLPPVLHYEAEVEIDQDHPCDEYEIVMEGSIFAVVGSGVERLIESVNFDDYESLNWFHRTLRKTGVIDALREKGAKEGSTVRIGEMEFDFVE